MGAIVADLYFCFTFLPLSYSKVISDETSFKEFLKEKAMYLVRKAILFIKKEY